MGYGMGIEMTIQDEINKLERQLLILKEKQSRCPHEWGATEYKPYIGHEERVLEGQYERYGIDMWPRSMVVDVEKPRWTRVCKTCGLVQHTEERVEITQPKILSPKFCN